MTDDELVHGGICPVCDEEFTDAGTIMGELEGESKLVKLCVVEANGHGTGGDAIIHLDEWLADGGQG